MSSPNRNNEDTSKNNCVSEAPFVEVNGIKYYSDRFYLNEPTGFTGLFKAKRPKTDLGPPLFDRAELVKSLDLTAVIVGTYVLDPAWLKSEFPTLFANEKKQPGIPTLVLHGDHEYRHPQNRKRKRRTSASRTERQQSVTNKKGRRSSQHAATHHEWSPLGRNRSTLTKAIVKLHDDDETPAEEGWRQAYKNLFLDEESDNCSDDDVPSEEPPLTQRGPLFGSSVHLTQILSTWVPRTEPCDFSSENAANCAVKTVELNRPVKGEDEGEVVIIGDDKDMTRTTPNHENDIHNSSDSSNIPKVLTPSTCASTDTSSDSSNNNIESGMGISNNIIKQRQNCMGVYHPKFFLLFERSGSLVVVVSTSNLTPVKSTEGSWVQRFPRRSTADSCGDNVDESTRCDGSDFGWVLSDFLLANGYAAERGGMTPAQFLKMYLGFETLDEFRSSCAFEQSCVHLIATIPGVYTGRQTSEHLGNSIHKECSNASSNGVQNRTFLYGPQRVADIFYRLQENNDSQTDRNPRTTRQWFPKGFLSANDRLILQPTSISGNWNRNNLTDVVRSYLAEADVIGVAFSRNHDILENADIIWPSVDFVDHCSKEVSKYKKSAAASFTPDLRRNDRSCDTRAESSEETLYVCLSSKIFNSVDIAFISRLSQYESSNPPSFPLCLTPHIKTYCRLLEPVIDLCGSDNECTEDSNENENIINLIDSPSPPCQKKLSRRNSRERRFHAERFAWFLLTSACMSRGAQGEAMKSRGSDSDAMKYANFELGVLFCSRLQDNPRTDRLYVWDPYRSSELGFVDDRQEESQQRRLIPLPVPYLLRPVSYQQDEDDADLVATPFFHEITEGTGAIGQMLLTPLGKKLAARLS